MSWRFVGWLTGIFIATLLFAELLLRPPNAGERLHLIAILGAPVAITVILVPFLGRWVSARTSVAGTALLVGLCSLALGAVTTSAASNAMFLSSHDYRLFLVVLVLSSGIALAVGSYLTRPLAADIARLGEVAERVAAGDFTARTGVVRNDEVGRTARAVDSMVVALDEAAAERTRAARRPSTAVHQHRPRPAHAPCGDAGCGRESAGRRRARPGPLLRDPRRAARRHRRHCSINSSSTPGSNRAAATANAPRCRSPNSPTRPSRPSPPSPIAWTSTCNSTPTVRPSLSPARPTCRACFATCSRTPSTTAPQARRSASSVRTGQQVEVGVHDHGPGFPDDFRDHAFEPFTRADPARNTRTGHSGLGLAIARALVEAHGGHIWLGAGAGADVTFSIPRKEPA